MKITPIMYNSGRIMPVEKLNPRPAQNMPSEEKTEGKESFAEVFNRVVSAMQQGESHAN